MAGLLGDVLSWIDSRKRIAADRLGQLATDPGGLLSRTAYQVEDQYRPLTDAAMQGDYKGMVNSGLLSPLTFAGIGAKTANKVALAKAQQMTKAGADPGEVWRTTGWTDQFPDKKWRFEIPDEAAKISDSPLPTVPINGKHYEAWNVGSVMRHDPLFGAYPELKSIEQSFQTKRGGTYRDMGEGGWISLGEEYKQGLLGNTQKAEIAKATAKYDKFSKSPRVQNYNEILDSLFDDAGKLKVSEDEFNAIYKRAHGPRIDSVRDKLFKGEMSARKAAEMNPQGGNALTPESKSVMLHELQHAIQSREGFARGGSPRSAADEIGTMLLKSKDRIREIESNPSFAKAKADVDSVFWKAVKGEISNDEFSKIINQHEGGALFKEWKRLQEVVRSSPTDAYDAYRRLAGEAEARLTQQRMNLTPEQRRMQPPWLSFDVPPEQQIVRGLLGQ